MNCPICNAAIDPENTKFYFTQCYDNSHQLIFYATGYTLRQPEIIVHTWNKRNLTEFIFTKNIKKVELKSHRYRHPQFITFDQIVPFIKRVESLKAFL